MPVARASPRQKRVGEPPNAGLWRHHREISRDQNPQPLLEQESVRRIGRQQAIVDHLLGFVDSLAGLFCEFGDIGPANRGKVVIRIAKEVRLEGVGDDKIYERAQQRHRAKELRGIDGGEPKALRLEVSSPH